MRAIVFASILSGCATCPMPAPQTKAQVRAQWKEIFCHLDAGANMAPCLSGDMKCCEVMSAK